MCHVKPKTNLFEFKIGYISKLLGNYQLVGGNKMSITIGNKNVIKCSTISGNIYQDCQEAIGDKSNKNTVVVNGVEIPLPPITEGGRNISIINDKVFVDGYEWKNGKWQKTLRALYHKYF